ncbi:MAG: glycerophosphodiester phosphodiesterase family protein [Nanoarchaeota archaeon]
MSKAVITKAPRKKAAIRKEIYWPPFLLAGHRGAAAVEPENTLRSFAAGLKAGANAIEFDTRLSKDKKLVVFHDATLERTTNGKGNIHNFTLAELRQLDAGQGERIPTAKEALEFIIRKNKAIALLEIKDKDSVKQVVEVVKGVVENKVNWRNKAIAGKKVENKALIKNQLLIHSFSSPAVRKIKQLLPTVPTAVVISNRIYNLPGFFRLCKAIKVDWIFARHDLVNKTFIAAAHKWKLRVLAWVCNNQEEMKKFLRMGIDGIASDEPRLFTNFHKSYKDGDKR